MDSRPATLLLYRAKQAGLTISDLDAMTVPSLLAYLETAEWFNDQQRKMLEAERDDDSGTTKVSMFDI